MTGVQRLETALASGGGPPGVAVCYEGIFVRDHWRQITDAPWWHAHSPRIEDQVAWRRDYLQRTGADWIHVAEARPLQQRNALEFEHRGGEVHLVNQATGEDQLLEPPVPGGTHVMKYKAAAEAGSDDLDALIPECPAGPFEETQARVRSEKRDEIMRALANKAVLPIAHTIAPLWGTCGRLGYEGLMIRLAEKPGFVAQLAERVMQLSIERIRVAAALGARAIWVEECLMDQISPALFAKYSLPLLQRLCEEIRHRGMHSIYYYCGNPWDRFDLLLESGAGALALEESKKTFRIDLAEVVRRVRGRCAIFGNLDAQLLQNGSDDELRAEVQRQLAVGLENDGRFVMSTGSPITPDTPAARVRQFHDLVHDSKAALVSSGR